MLDALRSLGMTGQSVNYFLLPLKDAKDAVPLPLGLNISYATNRCRESANPSKSSAARRGPS